MTRIEIETTIDPIDLSNALYKLRWREQAEYVVAIMKGLDSDAVSEIAEWAAEELGMELKYK